MSDVIAYTRMKERKFAAKLEQATSGSAGWDIGNGTGSRFTLHVGKSMVIPSGIKCVIPPGYEVQVRSRSGLSSKYGVIVLNAPGTIDSDYRGEIGIIVYNAGESVFYIEPGMRLAQLVPAKLPDIKFVEQETFDLFGETNDRGENGFGSTGH